MTAVHRFEDLVAWQKARHLAKEIYLVSASPPISKDFGFRDQITRAAVSIMNNIAEGFGRRGDKEFAKFLRLAKGSAAEVQSRLYIGSDIGYIDNSALDALLAQARETAAVVTGLLEYVTNQLKAAPVRQSKP